ncbi:RmlC-like cupin domain-containing protein [Trichoderma sp. SZMC 28011]
MSPNNLTLDPTPLSNLRISKHQIPAHDLIPNSSLQSKPLIIYHSAFSPAQASPDQIESHLIRIGVVTPQWRYTMYNTTHFHSTTHEVLCVTAGRAKLCFGGECNPGRIEPVVKRGDVIIVPAGVSHRLLEDKDRDPFLMVGSYPNGNNWDMCYGKHGEESMINNIKNLPWFSKDPIYGDEGPVLDA